MAAGLTGEIAGADPGDRGAAAAVAVSVKILRKGKAKAFPLPSCSTEFSAGVDLRASEEALLLPGERAGIPTGLYIELPEGYEAQVRPRSGLAIKNGITVINSPGTIDSDYRGEIRVLLVNLGSEAFSISAGDRIAQMVVAPVTRISWIEEETLGASGRGDGGFGSTGTD